MKLGEVLLMDLDKLLLMELDELLLYVIVVNGDIVDDTSDD
jgi:hypothetical protein